MGIIVFTENFSETITIIITHNLLKTQKKRVINNELLNQNRKYIRISKINIKSNSNRRTI